MTTIEGEVLKKVGIKTKYEVTLIDEVAGVWQTDAFAYIRWRITPEELASSSEERQLASAGDYAKMIPKDLLTWLPHVEPVECNSFVLASDAYFARGCLVYCTLHWTIEFRECFWLRRFPFDRQHLEAQLECKNAEFTTYTFLKNDEGRVMASNDVKREFNECEDMDIIAQTALPKWELVGIGRMDQFVSKHETLEFTTREKKNMMIIFGESWLSQKEEGFCKKAGNRVQQVHLYIQRIPSFYMWNVVGIVGPLSFITVSTGMMPPEDMVNRMMFTLTLLLTSMAFKFVLISILPPVPYLTILDKYVLTGFALICLDGMKNIFVKSLHSADAVNNADLIYACDYLFMYGFVGLWTLATIVILLGSVFPIFYRPWGEVKIVSDHETTRKRVSAHVRTVTRTGTGALVATNKLSLGHASSRSDLDGIDVTGAVATQDDTGDEEATSVSNPLRRGGLCED